MLSYFSFLLCQEPRQQLTYYAANNIGEQKRYIWISTIAQQFIHLASSETLLKKQLDYHPGASVRTRSAFCKEMLAVSPVRDSNIAVPL